MNGNKEAMYPDVGQRQVRIDETSEFLSELVEPAPSTLGELTGQMLPAEIEGADSSGLIQTDGASIRNPGQAGGGMVCLEVSDDWEVQLSTSNYFLGYQKSNIG